MTLRRKNKTRVLTGLIARVLKSEVEENAESFVRGVTRLNCSVNIRYTSSLFQFNVVQTLIEPSRLILITVYVFSIRFKNLLFVYYLSNSSAVLN